MGKNFFLISHLNLPSCSLELFPLVLSLHPLVKSPSPSFLSAPPGTGSCSKVAPDPSLLQAEPPQLSQPVLVGEVLQPSDHLRGPPLDPHLGFVSITDLWSSLKTKLLILCYLLIFLCLN